MATTALNTLTLPHSSAPRRIAHRLKGRPRQLSRFVNNAARDGESVRGDEKGKLLVLGGTGFATQSSALMGDATDKQEIV